MKFKLSFLLLLLVTSSSFAQLGFDYHQNEIILNLRNMSASEIDDLRTEFEADELWVSPLTETRCWYFDVFPGILEVEIDGQIVYITDIIDAAEQIKNRASGGTGGVSISVNPTPTYTAMVANTPTGTLNTNLYLPNGTNKVQLSILDSGSSPFIDDSQGYYYNPNILSNTNYISGSSPFDENSHGTHILGISNHMATNGAPSSDYINFDVRKILDANNKGDLGAYLLSIEEAIVEGAQVLNLSLTFPEVEGNYFLNILVGLIEQYNILGVVAAGNDGFDLSDPNINGAPGQNESIFPAALQSPNLITVAAVPHGSASGLSDFSNYGIYNVDVAIQGEMIFGYDINSAFIPMSGTSQATGIVSGIAANLGTHLEEFDGAAIKCAIMEGVDIRLALQGKIVSGGVVNAFKAYNHLMNNPCGGSGTGGGRASSSIDEMTAYPNPFTKVLYLDILEGNNKIQITDLSGKVIYSNDIEAPKGGMTYTIDQIDNNIEGLLLVNIQNLESGQIKVSKVIKY